MRMDALLMRVSARFDGFYYNGIAEYSFLTSLHFLRKFLSTVIGNKKLCVDLKIIENCWYRTPFVLHVASVVC